MTLRELIADWEHPLCSGDASVEVRGLTADSRQVEPGRVFFALRGHAQDGHDYITAAIAAGASAIVAQRAPEQDEVLPWVHVADSRLALARAAERFYANPSRSLQLLGVTGTNGKTTTAYLMHHLMNAGQRRCGLVGTVQYDVGGRLLPATHTTPQALDLSELMAQMLDHGCKACAMEVSSHALDQSRVAGLEFAAAVFTNLTRDHLDYHGSMDAYFKAKLRLFEMVATQTRGHLIVNADDSWGRRLIERFSSTGRLIRFGFGVGLEFRAINPRYDLTGTSFELEAKGRSFMVRMPLIGDFNVHNALAALACVQAAGLNLRESLAHLRRAPQVPGRLERVSSDASRFQVFVDYAHTPDALENVLKTLRGLRPRRILTVFGCGGDRDRGKRPRMAAAAEAGSDICVVTSDNPRSEDPQAIADEVVRGFARPRQHPVVLDRREAIDLVLRHAKPGDLVLIAGKGHEDYQEVMGRRTPFDDRRVVRQLLEDLSVLRDQERREQEAERLARQEEMPPRPPRRRLPPSP